MGKQTGEQKRFVIFDLDNTLVDRVSAVRLWIRSFVESVGTPANSDLTNSELMSQIEAFDGDGYVDRALFFKQIADLLGSQITAGDIAQHYETQYPSHFSLHPDIRSTLQNLRALGYTIGIATNGPPFQENVISTAGLDKLVDGWVVSAIEGIRKPDPGLLRVLADRVGSVLANGVMVGDGKADVAVAHAAGIQAVWITRGLTWLPTSTDAPPHHQASDVPSAVQAILDRAVG